MSDKLKDRDIREPLFLYLEEKYGKIRILEEIGIGRSRADAIMILSDRLIGLEIKSDKDTYTRLISQVKSYNDFFDFNYLIVGSTHAMSASKHLPEWWGIISVEKIKDRFDFYIVREAKNNPKDILNNKLSLLWRTELFNIQLKYNMYKYKDKSKAFVRDKIVEKIDRDLLNHHISDELFERDYNTIKEEIEAFRNKRVRKTRYRRVKKLNITRKDVINLSK